MLMHVSNLAQGQSRRQGRVALVLPWSPESAEQVASETSAVADGALHGEGKHFGAEFKLCQLVRVVSESSKFLGISSCRIPCQHGPSEIDG